MTWLSARIRTACLFAAGLGALGVLGASDAWAADGQRPKEGDPAPLFDLPATQINKVLPDKKDAKTLSLKELRGKKNVVLFFYPKANTGG